MSLAHLDLDHDGLLHLGRNHVAHLLITPGRRRLLLSCYRHLPAPFFVALAAAVFFALFLAADLGPFFTLFFAPDLAFTGLVFADLAGFFAAAFALIFSSPAGKVETSSWCAPRMPSARSRETVLICAISLRSWRSFFTPSFCPIETWKRSRNSCSPEVFSW